ncbi:MAG: GTPase HflX [Gemmatimonadota bacterium]
MMAGTMIDVSPVIDRAILVAAPHPDEPQDLVDEHLEELERLVDTAGAEVCGTLVQRVPSPHSAFYIGSGKVDQLRLLAETSGATLIVFDENLTPGQGSALEKRLGIRVMDRTEVILDIFALRARSAESRLQVELAQLQYLRTRLKRMWTHLSRTQGGIGTRGPGETQLETDRRIIDRRIARLRRELKHIQKSRETRRQGRSDTLQFTLVGYTNAGKSSLLKALSGTDVFVEDRLFATLDSATRSVDLGDGYTALITDTVGFIRKLPHHLVASFRATLEEVQGADLLLHVIDASSPGWQHQVDAVNDVLASLDLLDQPTLLVFNKIDQLTHAEEQALAARTEAMHEASVLTSVREPHGLDSLLAALRSQAQATRPTVVVTLPVTDGRLLAEAYREGEVLERVDGAKTIRITARVPLAVLGRWRRHPDVSVAEQDAA